MTARLSLWWLRLRELRWRRIALGGLLTVGVVAVVPPLRRVAGDAASRAILFVASPFAPDVSGFRDLPQATRVLAADGSEVARLGDQERHPSTRWRWGAPRSMTFGGGGSRAAARSPSSWPS